MAKKLKKTNAMRILDSLNLEYEILSYDFDEEHLDGVHASQSIGLPASSVYKTLVTTGENGIVVGLIPVDKTLDLKALARESGSKKLEMIHVKDIVKLTGYQRGGCSPLGMKKQYPTFIDQSVLTQKQISVSGGVRGKQIYTTPEVLIKAADMKLADIVMK